MSERLSIQLTPALAREMHRVLSRSGEAGTEAQQLLDLADEHEAQWIATHPGSNDPLLLPFFEVEAPDHAAAEELVARLRRADGVDGAYQKPPPALP